MSLRGEQAFNVVVCQPEGYVHANALADVARLVTFSLRSLGYRCHCQANAFDADAVNIVLGSHLLASSPERSRGRVIIYQLEPLIPEVWAQWPGYEDTLRRADGVWEFAAENLAALADLGVRRAVQVPLGFHEAMETIPHRRAEADVLFYGSINARRQEVVAWLATRCRVKTLFGVYGEERDEWIARSRIVLNIHFYESAAMEQARIGYLLNNGRFVVSEGATVNPFGEAVVTAPWKSLGECCLEYLRRPDERTTIARCGYNWFRGRRMVDHLATALEATSRWW